MSYIPITPFRRAIDAALLKHQQAAMAELPSEGVDKWAVLREVAAARKFYGLSDRGVSVLQALLSFHPRTVLGGDEAGLVVYPSNTAICDRLNGMACSTMRRHLGTLVEAGLILRRDSPNGKRFVKRLRGQEQMAFGFDLTPLVLRFAEISAQAEKARIAVEQHEALRRTVSLMRRDLASLVTYGQQAHPEALCWDALSDAAILTARSLRRTLDFDDLRHMEVDLRAALNKAQDAINAAATEVLSISEAQIEQHHQNSNKECNRKKKGARGNTARTEAGDTATTEKTPDIPLATVLAVCTELKTYIPDKIKHWHHLVKAAEFVGPMMGISRSVWNDAASAMGPKEAAIVVAAMLQRFDEIRSSGGYLRHLTRKARHGEFSCGAMIAALIRRDGASGFTVVNSQI